MIVDYTTLVGMVAIGIGGVSSALWGTIIAVKYKKYSIKKILKDFFAVKQKFCSYLFVLLFLLLDFCYVVFNGKLVNCRAELRKKDRIHFKRMIILLL